MNKLFVLKNMGFKISWKLIAVGLFGCDEIEPIVTHFDVIDYLDCLLTTVNEQSNDAVELFCEKDDIIKFDVVLKKFASKDTADVVIQKRKWRACLLESLLKNLSQDCLQGQLELMEFWVKMGKPNNCPQDFPKSKNKKAIQNYFTKESYELYVSKSEYWLRKEIASIIKLET